MVLLAFFSDNQPEMYFQLINARCMQLRMKEHWLAIKYYSIMGWDGIDTEHLKCHAVLPTYIQLVSILSTPETELI